MDYWNFGSIQNISNETKVKTDVNMNDSKKHGWLHLIDSSTCLYYILPFFQATFVPQRILVVRHDSCLSMKSCTLQIDLLRTIAPQRKSIGCHCGSPLCNV